MSLVGLHQLGALVTVIVFVWCSIGVPALADNQDVGALTEGIGENGSGAKVDIGVVARSLVSRAAVEVPLWKIFDSELAALWDFCDGLNNESC
jgi:hypothetical protein